MLRGTITLDISKATEKTPAKSELLDIGGYKWQVRCPEKGNPASFEIECNQNCTADLWLCSAKFSCETRKTGKAKWKHCGTWESLWFNSYAIKAEQFMEVGQRKGLWPNHIRIHIEVLWCAKQSSLPTIDATLKMRFDGDSELDPTNAQLIPINQYVLATHSDFFADLFLNNKNNEGKKFVFDAQKPVYELQESADIDIWRFRFMLQALLVNNNAEKRPILGELKVSWTTGDEKEYKIELLKQAHKYRLKTFVVLVEELLTEKGMSTMEFLRLADEHSLIELKQRCLDKMKPIEFCNELDANIGCRALLGEETRRLLDAKLKE